MAVNKIKAVILAAGKGTRMKSSKPKVLQDIFSKTLLERVIDSVLKVKNIEEIFLVVGHQADEVTNYVKDKYKDISYPVTSVLQQPQLGTGDAVFKAYDHLKDFKGSVIVLCGDAPLLTTETLSGFVQSHEQSKSDISVLSAIIEPPGSYGRIIRKQSGSVNKIVEAKDANEQEKLINEVNTGVYCLNWQQISPVFFDLTTDNEQGEYYLTDIIEWGVKKDLNVSAHILEDANEAFGINSRADLAKATYILNQRKLQQLMNDGVTIVSPENTSISPETQIGMDSVVFPGCYIDGVNTIGENCVLGPNLYIEGNVTAQDNVKLIQSKISDAIIGKNSSVGPFAHLRGNVEVTNDVRIGNFVEVKKSLINKNTNIAHLSYIGDSELGKNVNIGAGTITANYNPLTKQKSKTILEDDVKIGSNSVLVAPVTVSSKANVAAGSVITKDVPENALAIARGKQTILEDWVTKKT